MKVIEKFNIEYVVPETEKEILEIKNIIHDFDNNKNRKIDFTKLKLVDNRDKFKNGFWREF